MDKTRIIIYLVTGVAAIISILFIMFLVYELYKYKIKSIKAGLEDEEIKEEYNELNKKSNKVIDLLSSIFSILLLVIFVISLFAHMNDNFLNVPFIGKMHVVMSGSMATKNESNDYLVENNLNNQFDVFDVIFINPIENDNPELYDVVVYKCKEDLIVHRIVNTIEKDGEIFYVLRGDANNINDKELVSLDQIIGKYTDYRIPFFGIFVVFLQSALGYIAIGLVFIMELYKYILEKKINKEIINRLKQINHF